MTVMVLVRLLVRLLLEAVGLKRQRRRRIAGTQYDVRIAASNQKCIRKRTPRWKRGEIGSSCVRCFFLFLLVFAVAAPLRAQDNYEIQVYGSDTVPPKTTMLELHSNFTADGSKAVPGSQLTVDGTYPTNHAQHETVEITQGLTSWSEVGFYIFTSSRDGLGVQWVGDHIRPRVRVPDSWHWPVGVSLSTEVGYQRRQFSPDTWTWEIRPMLISSWAGGTSQSIRHSSARFTAPVFPREWNSRLTQKSATTSQKSLVAVWSITDPMAAWATSTTCTISSNSFFLQSI
jgi:hypothetical protein